MQEFTFISNQMRFMSTFKKITPYSTLQRLVGACQSRMHKDIHVQSGFNICASTKHFP